VGRFVSFTITVEQLRFHHDDLQYGAFIAYIGSNSQDVQALSFQLKE
jgi:beta-glucosidase